MTAQDAYERQVAAEVRQFADGAYRPAAASYGWWYQRHHAPRLETVFGTADHLDILTNLITECQRRTGLSDVLCIGTADCVHEIELLQWADSRGAPPFRIHALELSPILVARARQTAAEAGLAERLIPMRADLNQGLPELGRGRYAAVLVTNALHHIVGLEGLFDGIHRVLHPEGRFFVDDVVGRNGHRRWPEMLGVMRALWRTLPLHMRHDFAHYAADPFYEDWDCATEGFEGVRAQDIMPLLLDRFEEDACVVFGGICEWMLDASYAANFDPNNPDHTAFIDRAQQLEDRILDNRLSTATIVFGAFRPHHAGRPPLTPKRWNGRGTAHTLRPPLPGLVDDLAALGFHSPFAPPPLPVLVSAAPGEPLRFGLDAEGQAALRWGWSYPEERWVWGLGAASALAFVCRQDCRQLALETFGTHPPGSALQTVALKLNGQLIGELTHRAAEGMRTSHVALPKGLLRRGGNLLEFETARFRLPDLDGGEDRRALSFAIASLTLISGF